LAPDTPVAALVNIGPVLAARLASVGAATWGDLERLGEDEIWARLRAALPADACVSSRLALAGAFRGVRWHELPAALRAELAASVR
jgi:DNA transformation protein and related proteins